MKIAVMGAGALGCYFGGRLAQAGVDISFIARGAHLTALQKSGLQIVSPLGDLHIPNVQATAAPAEVGPVDIIMFLVKLPDTESAAAAMSPMLGEQTAVVSFQNGVDAWGRLGDIVGSQRVIGGTAVIPATISGPGIIKHNGPFARLTFGEFDGVESSRCTHLLKALEEAQIEADLVTNIEVKIWEKFIMLSALSALTALTRLPIGTIMADAEARKLFEAAIFETHAVGRVICPELSPQAGAAALERASQLPAHMRASMLDDLERGKPMELEGLSGTVARLGREHGVPTPTHEFVFKALHPYAAGCSTNT